MFAEWVHMEQKAEPGLEKQKPTWFPAPLSQRGRKPRLGFTPQTALGGAGAGGGRAKAGAQTEVLGVGTAVPLAVFRPRTQCCVFYGHRSPANQDVKANPYPP